MRLWQTTVINLQPRKGRRRPPREFPGLYRRCLNVLSLFVILFSTLAPFRINLTLTLILINCAHPTDVYLNSAVLKLWIFTSPAGFWSMDKISRRMLDKICVMIGDLFVFYWFGRIWKWATSGWFSLQRCLTGLQMALVFNGPLKIH